MLVLKSILLMIACSWPFMRCSAQTTPKELGLNEEVLAAHGRNVHYLLSVDRHSHPERKPLLLFLQGSGPRPLQEPGVRDGKPVVKSLLMVKPQAVAKDFHYVVLMKPGVPFYGPANFQPGAAYYQWNSLASRVEDAEAVISDLISQPWVDRSRVLVIGHSEGSDVAAKLASTDPNVTHVVCLGAGGLSQMYDFAIGIRKAVQHGSLTENEAEKKTQELYATFQEIFADPASLSRYWQGETYRYWHSFLAESTTDNLLKTRVPVFVAIGTEDTQVPIETAEITPIEFIRAQNKLLTFVHLPGAGHSMLGSITTDEGTRQVDYQALLLIDIERWMRDPGHWTPTSPIIRLY